MPRRRDRRVSPRRDRGDDGATQDVEYFRTVSDRYRALTESGTPAHKDTGRRVLEYGTTSSASRVLDAGMGYAASAPAPQGEGRSRPARLANPEVGATQ